MKPERNLHGRHEMVAFVAEWALSCLLAFLHVSWLE